MGLGKRCQGWYIRLAYDLLIMTQLYAHGRQVRRPFASVGIEALIARYRFTVANHILQCLVCILT